MDADPTLLTPVETTQLQADLKKAILLSDVAIYGTAKELPTTWDKFTSMVEDLFTFGTLTEVKERVTRLHKTALDNWESRKKILWDVVGTGKFEGQPLNETQREGLFKMVYDSIGETRRAIELVNEYAKGDVLTSAVEDTFGKLTNTLSDSYDSVLELAKGVASVAEGVGTTLKAGGSALPWIIGALLIGPFVIRSFLGYKRGGSAGAAEAAAGELERSRAASGRAVASGARAAAKFVF